MVDKMLLYNKKKYDILNLEITKTGINQEFKFVNITVKKSLYIDIDSELGDLYIFYFDKIYFLETQSLEYFLIDYEISSTYYFKCYLIDIKNITNDFVLNYYKQYQRHKKLKNII